MAYRTPDTVIIGPRLSRVLSKAHATSTLIYLLDAGPSSANKVSRGVGCDVNTASDVADHLELHGLASVSWEESPFPGRDTKLLELTEIGRQLALALRAAAEVYEPVAPPAPPPTARGLPRARLLIDRGPDQKEQQGVGKRADKQERARRGIRDVAERARAERERQKRDAVE